MQVPQSVSGEPTSYVQLIVDTEHASGKPTAIARTALASGSDDPQADILALLNAPAE